MCIKIRLIEHKYLDIPFLGSGLYTKFLIGMMSACAFSEKAVFITFPFALPIGACDLRLSEYRILELNVSFILGKSS